MRKKIMIMVMLTIGIIIGLSASHFYFKYHINMDFVFSYKIPKFSSEEESFIKQNICNIYNHIDQPEKYFICNVEIKANEVIVGVSHLFTLQDGESSDGTFYSFTHDNAYKILKFDKNGNFLSIFDPKS